MTSLEEALQLERDDLTKKLLQSVHDWMLECSGKPLIQRMGRGARYAFIDQKPDVEYAVYHDGHYDDYISFRKRNSDDIEAVARSHIYLHDWKITVDYVEDTEESAEWNFKSLLSDRSNKPVVLPEKCKYMIRDIVENL